MSELMDASPAPPRLPQPTTVGPPIWWRIIPATIGLFASAIAATMFVSLLPARGAVSELAAFATGLVVIPVVASPLEWFVHRFVYHQAVLRPLRTIAAVHTAHHYAFFPTWRYTTAGPARRLAIRTKAPDVHRSSLLNAGVRAAHFAWYLGIGLVVVWIPAWLLTGDVRYLAGLVVASLVVSNLFIVVHDTIHRPGSHRLVEAQPWFGFLDRHHYLHHVALGANLNFLLPLADLLFGSLRTTLSPDELERHGPLEVAKLTPLGQGERARAALR